MLGVCRRVFFLFTTILVSNSIVGVEAAREGSNIPEFDDKTYSNGSEYWQGYKGGGKNYFAGNSKSEKVKTATKQVKSENSFKTWWRERPPKEDVDFIWERSEDQSKRRTRKKKKRIVKTHDHKFAILHNDL